MSFGKVTMSAQELERLPPAQQRLAKALAAEMGAPLPVKAVVDDTPPAGGIDLGRSDFGKTVYLDIEKLLDGRLLVQGTSGAGKSWTLRRIVEQTNGLVQQIIIDPEGEFGSIAQHYDFPILDGTKLDPAALAVAAGRVREHRLSVLLDLSQLDRETQMQSVTAFVGALIAAPRENWHPAMIVIDEAHLFAPFGGAGLAATSVRQAATQTITDLMSRGRKRGLAGVLATQRIAKLAKSVSSEVLNFMIGLNTLDIDIRRAAETIGWDASKGFDRLPMLKPGDFVASGPAFSQAPATLHIGPVETRHIGARPEMVAPAMIDAAGAASLLDLEQLHAATAGDEEIRSEASIPPAYRSIRAFIREPAFADAGRVWEVLRPLAPQGAAVADLADYLSIDVGRVSAALALLDSYGAVEISDLSEGRAVRVGKGMTI
ncbi:ATP-binding protein [Rhizobium leguminosarum]|uniref:ATP-binding protein n=1 Tax=Rhizobium leguminosarum TaxID=384 RepID=UPI002F9458BE